MVRRTRPGIHRADRMLGGMDSGSAPLAHPGMTKAVRPPRPRHTFSLPRRAFASRFLQTVPLKPERAREMRRRRLRPQPCVQNRKHTSVVTTVTPAIPAFPATMVLRFPSCSPRRSGFVVSVPSAIAEAIVASLTPASRRQDDTTSPSASVPFVKGTSVSIVSRTQRS